MTTDPETRPGPWTWLAALVAVAAVGGSLYLSLGLDLKACPLCLYQRAFVMGAAVVLLAGLSLRDVRGGAVSALALGPAGGGLAVAGFHVYREAIGAMECPHGLFQLGSAPQQSLALHGLLVLLLIIDVLWNGLNPMVPLMTLVLGGLLGYGAIASVPRSLVPDHSLPVDQDMCRPPLPPAA